MVLVRPRRWRCGAEAAEVLGDPQVARRAGKSALEPLRRRPTLKKALRALGSPEFVYRNVVRADAKFNWGPSAWRVVHARPAGTPGCATSTSAASATTPRLRLHQQGCCASCPGLFGLAPGAGRPLVCGVRGDRAAAVRRSTWSPRAAAPAARRPPLAAAAARSPSAASPAAGRLLPAARRARGIRRRPLESDANTGRPTCGGATAALRERGVAEQDDAARSGCSPPWATCRPTCGPEGSSTRRPGTADLAVGRQAARAASRRRRRACAPAEHSGVPAPVASTPLHRWATRAARTTLRQGGRPVDDVPCRPGARGAGRRPRSFRWARCARRRCLFRDEVLGAIVALAHGSMVFLPHEDRLPSARMPRRPRSRSPTPRSWSASTPGRRDPLTGLGTGARSTAPRHRVKRAKRDGRPLALVMIDLDGFKEINDTHGHPFGDGVLQGGREDALGGLRAADSRAVGGDEFAMLCPGTTPSARGVVERARAGGRGRMSAAAPDLVGGRRRATPGARRRRARCSSAPTRALLREGGRAAPHGRRYDPGARRRGRRRPRRGRDAARRPAAIVPVFQPIVSLTDGAGGGYEALARFPDRPTARRPDEWFAEAHRARPRAAARGRARARAALCRPAGPTATLPLLNMSLARSMTDEVWLALPDRPQPASSSRSPSTRSRRRRRAGARRRAAARARRADRDRRRRRGLRRPPASCMRLRPDVIKLDRSLVAGVGSDPQRRADRLVRALRRRARQTRVRRGHRGARGA